MIGAILAVVALYLRRRLIETESFAVSAAGPGRSNPIRNLMRYPRELLTVAGLTRGGTLAFYTYTTYMKKFMVNTTGFDKNTATLVSTSALFVFMLLQPLVGALSDRIGRRPILIGFGSLGSWPLCRS
jgi:MFS transporter, MHS family, alpha-ketoglutarate permease